jgi:hypothetical protein
MKEPSQSAQKHGLRPFLQRKNVWRVIISFWTILSWNIAQPGRIIVADLKAPGITAQQIWLLRSGDMLWNRKSITITRLVNSCFKISSRRR